MLGICLGLLALIAPIDSQSLGDLTGDDISKAMMSFGDKCPAESASGAMWAPLRKGQKCAAIDRCNFPNEWCSFKLSNGKPDMGSLKCEKLPVQCANSFREIAGSPTPPPEPTSPATPPPEGGKPPPEGGKPPPEGGKPPPEGGKPPPEGGKPPPEGGKPPPEGGKKPPPEGGKPPPEGGKPPPEGGKPPPEGGKPPPEGGKPPPEGGKPPPEGGKPPPEGGKPPPEGGKKPPPGEPPPPGGKPPPGGPPPPGGAPPPGAPPPPKGGTAEGPPPNPDCCDYHEYCCFWASRGECQTNKAFMAPICQQSCKSCGCTGPAEKCEVAVHPQCTGDHVKTGNACPCKRDQPVNRDWHDKCPKWAQKGECEKNRNYMKANCKISCSVCE